MLEPPRVMHLLGTTAEGGAETYFQSLVLALARAGDPTSAAIRANLGREHALTSAGVPFRVFDYGNPLDLGTRPALGRWAREQEAQVLLAWMNRAARHSPRGPWKRIGRLGGYYDLKYYRGFDMLVGNTADIRDWIVSEGWPAERVTYIPNFASADSCPPASRAAEDTPEAVPLLLGMGRLHPAKAHDVSLRALRRIPDAWLWIAGVGPLEDELKRLARDLGVAERVRFLGWRRDAGALYRAADVCVFPSRYEPLGNVVIQAWVHGLPLVAAASRGPAGLIRDGVDGRLVPVDAPDALAEAVCALLADPAGRAELAAAGARRVASEFSEDAIVEQWRALFQAVGGARCAA
ncbi:glycosyltransferase [Caulobacter sp. 17J80-11]|uniref:glycosyltransferase n=1 Tax=Caulobacter sp. 17J80-11 TaxID=2763502 RepID=UPI001653E6E9|nr:glycosyltransferase [Caulobacter sp. 17J80-11]MBC6982608.1 glycosyltransferase [Caulobacter sp. 17J80-11]